MVPSEDLTPGLISALALAGTATDFRTVYEQLDPHLRGYVDQLLAHARTALWPERRAALASFRNGIVSSASDDLGAAVKALDWTPARDDSAADVVFCVLLTAYLERLDETEVNNPDQALLYSASLNEAHVRLAEAWFETHPEHRD